MLPNLLFLFLFVTVVAARVAATHVFNRLTKYWVWSLSLESSFHSMLYCKHISHPLIVYFLLWSLLKNESESWKVRFQSNWNWLDALLVISFKRLFDRRRGPARESRHAGPGPCPAVGPWEYSGWVKSRQGRSKASRKGMGRMERMRKIRGMWRMRRLNGLGW